MLYCLQHWKHARFATNNPASLFLCAGEPAGELPDLFSPDLKRWPQLAQARLYKGEQHAGELTMMNVYIAILSLGFKNGLCTLSLVLTLFAVQLGDKHSC